jgi:flavin reductase (DIM6/NTAB) family NADH-FMN oxidoreductase RutF
VTAQRSPSFVRPGGPSWGAPHGVWGRFAAARVVLTAGGDHRAGVRVGSLSPVSLDPLLVACRVDHGGPLRGAILGRGAFAVSVLGAGQDALAQHFADPARPSAPFGRVGWRPGPHTGAPLLEGSPFWLECRLAEIRAPGAESVFVGEVLSSSWISRAEEERRASA